MTSESAQTSRAREPRIVIIDAGHAGYDIERAVVENAGGRLDVFEGDRLDRQGRIAFAQGAAAIIVRGSIIDGAFMDALPGLRGIVRCGVGCENIDIAAATARGIRVANVQGYGNHSVSDHALMLILACMRDLSTGIREFRETFGRPPRQDVIELREAVLGIIGLGRIGGALAEKAGGLFRRVIACDPYVPDDRFRALRTHRVDLAGLLAESDVISINCTLTPETAGMLGRDAFGKMRRRPVLVNTARGAIIDDAALIDALDRGVIHSAGLDVFSEEPPLPKLEALIAHPRVVATGHYGFYSIAAMAELQRRAAENALALVRGDAIPDCLNPEVPVPPEGHRVDSSGAKLSE